MSRAQNNSHLGKLPGFAICRSSHDEHNELSSGLLLVKGSTGGVLLRRKSAFQGLFAKGGNLRAGLQKQVLNLAIEHENVVHVPGHLLQEIAFCKQFPLSLPLSCVF